MIAHRRGRVIVIDETARRPIRLVPARGKAKAPVRLVACDEIDPYPTVAPGGGIGA